MKIKGVVGRVALVKSSDPATPQNLERALEQEEVSERQTIFQLRFKWKESCQVQLFRALKAGITLTLHGSVNQAWTVACLLCNFMDPLIKQNQGTTASREQDTSKDDL